MGRRLLILWLGFACGCGGGGGDGGDETTSSPTATQWLTEITSSVGIDFVHETGATGDLHMAEVMGAGCALFDYDNDGDLDLYLTTSNRTLPAGAVASAPVNRLYRQEADGRFVDVTIASGLGDGGYGMGVAVGDIDNDGDADVYVTNYGRDRLYRNRGDGTFVDITDAAGLEVDGWSCSAAFFDYDGDGFLDLFVTQYVNYTPRRCFDLAGRPDYCGPLAFPPRSDVLLHNNGDGTFSDVSEAAGITVVAAAGLGVVCEDLDDDGRIDVYVANDAYPNHLWINRGDGTFEESAVIMGAAYNLHGQPEAGMGVLAADLDNDLALDLFVTHLRVETNTHYRNLGAGAGFIDTTGESGLGASSMLYTGFGVAAFDLELDGDLDIFVVNGRVNRLDPLEGARPWTAPPWDFLAEPNLFYLNAGGGRFVLTLEPVEAFTRPIEVTRGLAIGDIDDDGDVDLVINNAAGPARLYRNDAPRRGHWLIVRPVDPALRRDAIGARVTVFLDGRRLMRPITRSFGYLSSSDPRAHFGLGDADRVERIEVRWPGGDREDFAVPGIDRVVELVRGTGRSQP